MGKYAEVLEGLAPLPVADQGYQDKVNEAKREFTVDKETGEILKLTPDQMADIYAQLREIEDRLEKERYALQVRLTAMEQLIAGSWEADEEGWGLYGASENTVRRRDGSAVIVEQTPEGKVVDKDAFRRWCEAPADRCMTCRQPMHADDVDVPVDGPEGPSVCTAHKWKPGGGLKEKLQLWPSTMNAIAKERTLAGAPPPDGVAVYARTTVKFRKA